MHVLGADLRFKRRTERAEQRRVQRLVAVGLRNRDIVFELAGDRLVEAVQHAERRVARGHVLDENAHAIDVEHLRERVVLLAHLLVHAVNGFFPTADGGRDARQFQSVADRLQDALHHLAAIAPGGLDLLGEDPVTHGVEIFE